MGVIPVTDLIGFSKNRALVSSKWFGADNSLGTGLLAWSHLESSRLLLFLGDGVLVYCLGEGWPGGVVIVFSLTETQNCWTLSLPLNKIRRIIL